MGAATGHGAVLNLTSRGAWASEGFEPAG